VLYSAVVPADEQQAGTSPSAATSPPLRPPPENHHKQDFRVDHRVSFTDQSFKRHVGEIVRINQRTRCHLPTVVGGYVRAEVELSHWLSFRSAPTRYADDSASEAFVNELPGAFFDVPVLWVHGHTHQRFDYRVRSCRVVCNPRGYVNWSGRIENKEFDPGLVIDVQPLAGDDGS